MAVEFGKHRAFDFQGFVGAFLYQTCTLERRRQRGLGAYARQHGGRCFGDEPVLCEVADVFQQQALALRQGGVDRVIDRHRKPGACKNNGPGPADKACTDDGDVSVHMCSLLQ